MKKVLILKTDGIGDLVLAVSGIRLLAEKFGEEKLIIAVLAVVAPLVRMQFPKAQVLAMPLLAKRKVLNLFVANFFRALPAWGTILRERFSVAVSFRHHRNYLQSFLLFSAGAKELVLSENMLSRGKKNTRDWVERGLAFFWRTPFVGYPAEGRLPLDLEANRRIVSVVLDREVTEAEILPRLEARSAEDADAILLSPLSSTAIKDYPLASWMRVFERLPGEWRAKKICLAGVGSQRVELEKYRKGLEELGYGKVKILETADVAELVEAVAGCGLTLTVDTASAHIACALGRAAVIVFSGLHRGVYGPWVRSERQVWLEAPEVEAGGVVRKKSHWHKAIEPSLVAEEILRVTNGKP